MIEDIINNNGSKCGDLFSVKKTGPLSALTKPVEV